MIHGDESEFSIGVLSPEKIEEAFKLVGKEEWNLTLSKFKELQNVFPSSIFIAFKEKSQEVLAVVSAIPTAPKQYLVGNLVTRQDWRGRGLGKKMMEHLKDRHRSDTLTLTAVPGVEGFYSKLGFKEVEHTHHIYFLKVDRGKVETACSNFCTDDIAIASYTPDQFEALNDYDKTARGYDGGKYLSIMTNTSNHFLVATSKGTGHIVGYIAGVDRPSHLLVDGLFADTDGIALCLFRDLMKAYPTKVECKIQVVEPRTFLVQFGDVLGTSHRYTRMAAGPVAPVALSKLYCVTDCDYTE